MQQKTLLTFLKVKLNNRQSDVFVSFLIFTVLILFVINDLLTGQYFTQLSLWLKMGGLSVCVFYAVIKYWSNKNADSKRLCAAMLMTAIGDYMLTINAYFIVGIGCFAVVHLFYLMRRWCFLSLKLKRYVLVFGIIMGIIMTGLMFFIQPVLYKIALGYGVILCLSLFTSSMLLYISEKKKKYITIFLGILLFFLCDTCVAIYNVSVGTMSHVIGVLIWIWYLPAQLCLVLSGDRYQYSKEEN